MKSLPDKLHLELVLLLLLLALAGSMILPIPFTRDQGIYSYIGWRWINDAIPYRDVWGHKGPLLYAIYAFFLSLSHGAMWGINLADLLARLATVAATYYSVLVIHDRRLARLAAFFAALPLACVFTSCWWNAQAETFMMPLLALSIGLALTRRRQGITRLMSGLLVAQAVMLKSTAFVHAFFLIIYLLVMPARYGKSSGRWDALLVFVGLIMGLVPWLWYFYSKDALPAMWESLVVFNTFHAGLQPGMDIKDALYLGLRGLWTVSGLLLIPALIPFLRWIRKAGDPRLGLAAGWFISALAQVIMQEKFFLYHWLVIIPPLGLLAAQGWVRGMAWFTGDKGAYRYLGFGLPALLVVVLIAQLFLSARFYIGIQTHYQSLPYLLGRISRKKYYARFSEEDYAGLGDFNFLASYVTASYLRQHSNPHDRVLVFGYEPLINYISARPSPSKFHSDYPLSFEPKSKRAMEYRRRARWTFMNDLNHDPPRYILLVENDKNALEREESIDQAREFTEFWNFLNEFYREKTVIQDFHIYERDSLRQP